MKTLCNTASRLLLACLLALAPMTGAAHAKRDAEMARKALLDGRIRSLSEITEMVKPELPGATVLEVELEVEDGKIVYEFKIIDSSGRLKEVEVDAATGKILKIEDDD